MSASSFAVVALRYNGSVQLLMRTSRLSHPCTLCSCFGRWDTSSQYVSISLVLTHPTFPLTLPVRPSTALSRTSTQPTSLARFLQAKTITTHESKTSKPSTTGS